MKKILLVFGLLLAAVVPLIAQGCLDTCREDSTDSPVVVTYTGPGLSPQSIAAIPKTPLFSLTPDRDLMYNRSYMQVFGPVTVHDAPNGNVIRTLDPGLIYVTAYERRDGWTRINPTEWVPSNVTVSVRNTISSFTGVMLPATPLPYTIGWILEDTYASPLPGAPASGSRLYTRYTQVNIYATQAEAGEDWHQIDADTWVAESKLAQVLPVERLETVDTAFWISIDLAEQVIIAYQDNRPVFATLVATGAPRWPTREGLFHIFMRKEYEHMTWGTVGDDYYFLEDVPFTMYFDDGRALHGAFWHDAFGAVRSHGCVNLTITDSKWFYDAVAAAMGPDAPRDAIGPVVYVYRSRPEVNA